MNDNVYFERYQEIIRAFKHSHCDEVGLITEALKQLSSRYRFGSILDIGAGVGDISLSSFEGHNITLLDVHDYGNDAGECTRVIGNFFDYEPPKNELPDTLLFCHVLQYLDDEPARLLKKVDGLAPHFIIEVTLLIGLAGLPRRILNFIEIVCTQEIIKNAYPPHPTGHNMW